jgi:putative peptide zinc metalloprotease protein
MIPVGGATKEHPAFFVIRGQGDQKPAILVAPTTPSVRGTPRAASQAGGAPPATAATPTATATPTTPAPKPVAAAALPFKLPDKPGAHDSQALATNTQDGGIKYDVVYSLVTVQGGDTVDEENSAYALASCKACMTVAVSFQLVLVVGQSDVIKPINVAEALNYNCPSCITTAIADQIVVTLKAMPSDDLLKALTEQLQKLNAISQLGAGGSPAAVAQQVMDVQHQIEQQLQDSGLLTNPGTPAATPTAQATATPSPSGAATATPTAQATPESSGTPAGATPTATATATPSPTATPTPETTTSGTTDTSSTTP